MPNLTNKKVLIILAYQDYQDREFEPVRDYLGMFGAQIKIASSSIGTATGKFGGQVEVDYILEDIHPSNYDAVIFIGGIGAVEFKNNPVAHSIARNAAKDCKILAAICIAPVILAKAGVLSGKKATIWSDKTNEYTAQQLLGKDVKYIKKDVVVDNNLVTANGPEAAHEFAETIAHMLD